MSVPALVAAELEQLGAARLPVFDVHSHTGADLDGSSRNAAEHAADLEPFGGRGAIFPFHVEGGYAAENERVLAEATRHSQVLVPFARIDPRAGGGAAQAAAALSAGARGIKLHPRSESFRLDHPDVDGVFGAAAEAGVPVLIHAGVGVGSFGPVLTDLAARHRRCSLILAHAGISDLAWLWRVLPEHPNVYFDTAWLNPTDLLALFALAPPGRILFGSDAPYMPVGLVMAMTLRTARSAGLSEEAIELVTGRQAEALLAGDTPLDGGPPPGDMGEPGSPGERRLASLLGAAGGALLAGGDPAELLELAAAAADDGCPGTGEGLDPRLPELISIARSCGEEALPALVLALSLAAAPGVTREAVLG